MTNDDLNNIPIFFILGRPRSGTTLLTTLFNAHPHVRIAPEFPVMLFLYQRFKNVKVWDEATIRSFVDAALNDFRFNTRRVDNLKIDKEFIVGELLRYKDTGSIQTFLKSINYYAFSVYKKEQTHWIGDKNPIYSISSNRLRNIFPDAKFICIIRDYRDNFISIRKLADKDVAVEAPNLPLQVGRWRYFTRLFLTNARRYPDRYHVIRYEDLVTRQEEIFKDLCLFLGLDYDPSVFDFHTKKSEVETIFANTVWEKFHENLLTPINTGRMNTWQDKLTEPEVRMADLIAGEYADKLGYERRYKGFNLLLFLKAAPMLVYNQLLAMLMIFGTYLPYAVSRWWFFQSLLLLKIYMRLKGKKNIST